MQTMLHQHSLLDVTVPLAEPQPAMPTKCTVQLRSPSNRIMSFFCNSRGTTAGSMTPPTSVSNVASADAALGRRSSSIFSDIVFRSPPRSRSSSAAASIAPVVAISVMVRAPPRLTTASALNN